MVSGYQAQISEGLAGLFVPGVSVALLEGPLHRAAAGTNGRPQVLTEAEYNSISHCATKRIDDYCRGRDCAHVALKSLGVADASILSGKQREPLWPNGVVGSITHTADYAADAVSRQAQVASLGIDCEEINSVRPDLWSHVCTAGEREHLAGLPPQEQVRQSALIFAVKEAFYKCQFPVTRAWVGFHDVSIELPSATIEWVTARIMPRAQIPLDDGCMSRLVARACFLGRWVVAGVSLTV